MRVIGMDIHRSFAQVAILEDGEIKRQLRVDLIRHRVLEFAETLRHDDEVVVEATGNSAAVERLLRPYVKRVAIANPRLVRAIAYARVKTDKIDAGIWPGSMPRGFCRRWGWRTRRPCFAVGRPPSGWVCSNKACASKAASMRSCTPI